MRIKNISKGDFNLASGKLKPGATGEATFEECKVLFSSKKAEHAQVKVATPKPKAKANG